MGVHTSVVEVVGHSECGCQLLDSEEHAVGEEALGMESAVVGVHYSH